MQLSNLLIYVNLALSAQDLGSAVVLAGIWLLRTALKIGAI
jgi:hypothetical protein